MKKKHKDLIKQLSHRVGRLEEKVFCTYPLDKELDSVAEAAADNDEDVRHHPRRIADVARLLPGNVRLSFIDEGDASVGIDGRCSTVNTYVQDQEDLESIITVLKEAFTRLHDFKVMVTVELIDEPVLINGPKN